VRLGVTIPLLSFDEIVTGFSLRKGLRIAIRDYVTIVTIYIDYIYIHSNAWRSVVT
jgi:hypothetical protein